MVLKKTLLFFMVLAFLAAAPGFSLEKDPAKAGPKTKCPVCGMFVAKYPDFLAQVAFKDGSSYFFDGAKDMFKYLLNMKKYAPKKGQADIEAVYVTDYYGVTPVDGKKAFYVLGSDVYGPMGKELVPFEKAGEAKSFLKDHKGKKILMFHEVNASVLKELD